MTSSTCGLALYLTEVSLLLSGVLGSISYIVLQFDYILLQPILTTKYAICWIYLPLYLMSESIPWMANWIIATALCEIMTQGKNFIQALALA